MSDPSARFVGSIPENYDLGLGPHFFVDFGRDLTQRVVATKPATVLEIAAGTGIVTRMLRDALPSSTHLIATDLNPPMLEIARKKFKSGEQVEFRQADAIALPYPDTTFDTIACQFGVMFFPEKDLSYREAHRTLKPGGHYIFNVWDSWEFNPVGKLAHETIASFFMQDPPTFYKVPFGYHQIDPIKSSLLAAGFHEISAHVITIEKRIPDPELLAKGLVLGNPAFEDVRDRSTADPSDVVAAVTKALHRTFGGDHGKMPLQAIVFSARKR
jgi:ubiquinone/menaquinone biosynthesis C-methylase UbiE